VTFWNGPAANWAVAIGTLILAFVAVFQEWIKSWFFKQILDLHIGTERPSAEKDAIQSRYGGLLFPSCRVQHKPKGG
jgi:hypothetical protein